MIKQVTPGPVSEPENVHKCGAFLFFFFSLSLSLHLANTGLPFLHTFFSTDGAAFLSTNPPSVPSLFSLLHFHRWLSCSHYFHQPNPAAPCPVKGGMWCYWGVCVYTQYKRTCSDDSKVCWLYCLQNLYSRANHSSSRFIFLKIMILEVVADGRK